MIGRETNNVGISPITAIFATPTLAALLAVFALHPERTYIQRELVDQTDGSLYLVQRELKRLEESGLIAREARGRQVEYRVNSQHPAFPGLQEALLASVALGDRLREAISGATGVTLAFVYGSIAAGVESAESDLDILIVGDLGLKAASVRLVPVLSEISREPNIVVMTEDELAQRVASGDHFIRTVLQEPKLWLVGDDAGLAALVG